MQFKGEPQGSIMYNRKIRLDKNLPKEHLFVNPIDKKIKLLLKYRFWIIQLSLDLS